MHKKNKSICHVLSLIYHENTKIISYSRKIERNFIKEVCEMNVKQQYDSPELIVFIVSGIQEVITASGIKDPNELEEEVFG